MRTDRKFSTLLVLMAVSFLFTVGWTAPAVALSPSPTKTHEKAIDAKAHRGPTKFAPRVIHRKPLRTRTARVSRVAATTSRAAAPATVCYSGCGPYEETATYTWSVPATAGATQETYVQPMPAQRPVGSVGPALPVGQPVVQPQAQTLGGVPTGVCYNTWAPGWGESTCTWEVPATAAETVTQVSSRPSHPRATAKRRFSMRHGRYQATPTPARAAASAGAPAVEVCTTCVPGVSGYGWSAPATAAAVPVQTYAPPVPPPAAYVPPVPAPASAGYAPPIGYPTVSSCPPGPVCGTTGVCRFKEWLMQPFLALRALFSPCGS